ncbi:MAG: 16S rRNA (guanine(527)-N(7))-methyltransferase RsmG [Synergistaceae bacterium]|nr:16S rRNA (guanine(527)-N(7))-methyltransferase RsmG [Synergistaceae bacterium]
MVENSAQETVLRKFAGLLASCTRARLTGTRGADDIYALQVQDCLLSLEYLPKEGRVIDVGSGGGLPGIVWAVYRPDLSVTLLDSVAKKCEAVRSIIAELGLSNIEVVCSRSEEFARKHRESFSLAGARALASAGVCAELLSPLVEVGGHVLTFKGEKVHEEVSEVADKWGMLGLSKPALHFYGGTSKCIVLWKKQKKCPAVFPRREGLAGTDHFWE